MYVCLRERFGTRNLGMHKSHFLAKSRAFYSCLKTMSCLSVNLSSSLSINRSSSLSASFIYPYCYSLKSGLGNGQTSSGNTGSRRRHKQRCEASKQVKDTGLFTSFFVKWLWTGVMEAVRKLVTQSVVLTSVDNYHLHGRQRSICMGDNSHLYGRYMR